MISYEQFKANVIGTPVDVDHAFGNQCWDLVALYNEQVVGVPASAGWGLPTGPDLDARDVWTYFENPLPQYFDKVQGPYQTGDIPIWGFDPDGHISIFDHAIDANNFVSLDQNWPIGSFVHLQNHNYNNVLGALRPKGKQMQDVSLSTGRILMFSVVGRDGQQGRPNAANGDCDSELNQNWVGKPLTNEFIASVWNSPEADNYRNKVVPAAFAGTAQSLDVKINGASYVPKG